jgi:large subunit ribosomal protein L2
MIYKLKPITPSQRQTILIKNKFNNNNNILKKNKKIFLLNSSGRNNKGHITVLNRGGRRKRLYRILEFNRSLNNIKGFVKTINYDPFRFSYLMGIIFKYNNFLKKIIYILAPQNIKKNTYIESGLNKNICIKPGNALPLKNIPVGIFIHNISLKKHQKSVFSRSAGSFSKLLQKFKNDYCLIRLKSGNKKKINLECFATIGIVSNCEHNRIKLGKAGRSRWFGKRPSVRGVAKNPVDHPHGGGEGKTSGGRPSVSSSGKITKGKPTVRKKRLLII